jgi:hypothetical protein
MEFFTQNYWKNEGRHVIFYQTIAFLFINETAQFFACFGGGIALQVLLGLL